MNPAFATMGASSSMGVKDERERTKGDDELDPYIKVALLPFDMERQTEDAVDAGHDPDWTGVDAKGKSIYKNRLEFIVKSKAAKRVEPTVEPRLRLEAWDEDVGVDDFLGQAIVPLWALIDPGAYNAKMAAVDANAKEARLKQFLSEAEEQKKELLDTKQGKQMTAGIVPHPPPGASAQKKRKKVRRMSTSLFEGQRSTAIEPTASVSATGAAVDEEDEEDEFDRLTEEVHTAEHVLDLERAERMVRRDTASKASPPAQLDLQPLPPLDGEPAPRPTGGSPTERRGGLAPQTLPLWSLAPGSKSEKEMDPSADNHRLSDGTVKRLQLTDRKGDKHVGWVEVKVSWIPDEAAIASIDTESRGSPRKGGGSPRKGRIIGRPMVGKLVVEILRGRGLDLCADEESTSAAADPVLFTAALVTLVSYVLLGGVFYVLNEEHCEDQVIPGLPLESAAGADSDGDGLITVAELTDWGRLSAPVQSCKPWTVVDAGYFTVITFTTIGYGDFGPSNPGSKVFTAFFALLGVTLIGAACGIVVGYFMEQLDMQLQKAAEAAKSNDAHEVQVDEEDGKADAESVKHGGNKVVPIPTAAQKQEAIARKKMADKRKGIYENFVHLLVTFALGMLLFHFFGNGDNMSFIDIFYAAVITSCSVGYGDYSFDSQTGRGLCTLYAIAAVPMVAKFVGSVSSYVRGVSALLIDECISPTWSFFVVQIIDWKQEELVQKALKRKLKHSDLIEMDEDGDG